MMNPKDVNLFVFDTKENFSASYTQDRVGTLYKNVILIQNREDFDIEYAKEENHPFIFVCHVFHAVDEDGDQHKGYARLKAAGIEEDYNIEAIMVTSGDTGEVMKNLQQKENETRKVFNYTKVIQLLREDKLNVNSKKDQKNSTDKINDFQFDFGIITALYQDEFEEVEKHFTWTENRTVGEKRYRIGHLNDKPEKKIVAVIPSATGMVDSAIIATQLLELFKPKYLLMSGVCGAIEGTNIGDVVVAKSVFTFQKGKVSDLKDENGNELELFNASGDKVDYDQLFDSDKNKIKISIEKFEKEHDTVLDFRLGDFVEPELTRIKDEINKSEVLNTLRKKIDIHFEPMACSTMVINKEGFFEDNIKVINRKTVAVEMESYGVARACQFGNEGKTKWIIFKSVMDNTKQKTDEAKRLAAHTSGLFMKYLLYSDALA